MRLKLRVQYFGTGLGGWQYQSAKGTPKKESVQGLLACALGHLLEREVKPKELVAAGRTDAGVHAWGQVCHVDVDKDLPEIRYQDGMNRFLPTSVRVVGVERVAESFHARFNAVARHYTYLLCDQRLVRPDLFGRVGHSRHELDVEAMRAGLELVGLGKRDFSSLRDSECMSKTPVCNVLEKRIWRAEDGLIHLEIGADRFLHHMVRNLMGTLVDIGVGKRPQDGLLKALDACDRRAAGMTFDACGLYLRRVDYKE